jgi:sec-independent protein translocase protein TatA
MFGIGMPELIIILVIILIIFGAGKLPEIGAGMGKAIRNFKGASDEEEKKTPDKIEEEKKPWSAAGNQSIINCSIDTDKKHGHINKKSKTLTS